MTDFFTTDFFVGNRERLQHELNSKLIVLTANGLLQRSADTTYPFRQDSNFWYLTGVKEPDYTLVIAEDETFLIEPKRWENRDQWDGAIDKRKLKENSGIKNILEHHEGWTRLDMLLRKVKKVHTLAPAEAYLEHFGFYTNPARASLLGHLHKHRKLEIVDMRKSLAKMRQIKQEPEIKAIKKAISITALGFARVQSKVTKYSSENEVAGELTGTYIKKGADGHAYEPIVAVGKNAATIHYVDNNQLIDSGELLLIDSGAEYLGYSSDITRTYATGKINKRQRAVYDSVMKVQKYAIGLLKPGLDMKAYEADVDKFMAKELKKLGLLSDTSDKKKLKKYYPHLTSHFLGLDTHDAADYTAPLAPGMVLTVEPGIYIPEESIGVRIEDNILVTKTGIEILSDKIGTNL